MKVGFSFSFIPTYMVNEEENINYCSPFLNLIIMVTRPKKLLVDLTPQKARILLRPGFATTKDKNNSGNISLSIDWS